MGSPTATPQKGGKKNRKFGRNRTKSRAMQRYRAENRSAVNRARRIKAHERRMAKKKAKGMNTPRGTARIVARNHGWTPPEA